MTAAVASVPQKAPGRKPRFRNPVFAMRLEPIDREMIREAARIYGMPVATWVRRAALWEALRVRIAAANVPHGLHPDTPVYRVLEPPTAGIWKYREEFRADGSERVWVSSFIDDGPPTISPDNKALVIDVIGYKSHSLLVAAKGLRWTSATPLGYAYWPIQQAANDAELARRAKVKAEKEAKDKAVKDATP